MGAQLAGIILISEVFEKVPWKELPDKEQARGKGKQLSRMKIWLEQEKHSARLNGLFLLWQKVNSRVHPGPVLCFNILTQPS